MFILAAAACLPAGASIKDTGKILVDSPDFIRREFTLSNEPILYTVEEDEKSEVVEFTILDSDFNKVNSFSTSAYPAVTAEYTRARIIEGPIGVYVEYTEDNIDRENISRQDFIQNLQPYYDASQSDLKEVGDELQLYPSDLSYYYYEIYGKKYPTFIYVWKNNNVYRRAYEYGYSEWGPTGQYSEPYAEQESYSPWIGSLTPKDASCVDYDSFKISQTLFNKDADFEWTVPIFEAVDCSYTTDYEKIEGKKVFSTGFKVESQNGSIVATVKYPVGYYGYTYFDPDIFMMNGKNYLIIDLQKIGGTEWYYAVYEVDADNSSVKAVAAPRRVSVAPTMPRRGTEVNIDLGNPAQTAHKVIVTSMSGRSVVTRNIEPGKSNITIDTANFEKGVYIVTVSDGKTTRENTRIVVR